jgi:hypothetical protein
LALNRTLEGASDGLDGYDCLDHGAWSRRPTITPTVRYPISSGLPGYAAIKYTAIVIIVLAILAFLAWYIVPAFD